MNLFNEVIMEIIKDGKSFRAHFPMGATNQDCFDALRSFADKIIEISEANRAHQEAQAAQDVAPDLETQSGE